MYDPGIRVSFNEERFEFTYDDGVYGPPTETRRRSEVRHTLRDGGATGPEKLYAIAMDVGRKKDQDVLIENMLLLGVCGYAKGHLGAEPIHSQGHIHAVSPHSGWSPPEIFEIWTGEAIIFMQEHVGEDPGRCHAVRAQEGEIVVVPPFWPHMVINADPMELMVFGAICDRGYAGYSYSGLRERKGLSYYPIIAGGKLSWEPNPRYAVHPEIVEKSPETYDVLGLGSGQKPLYLDAIRNPRRYRFVPFPGESEAVWSRFIP
jgi:glucose-6-phosphate isomerase